MDEGGHRDLNSRALQFEDACAAIGQRDSAVPVTPRPGGYGSLPSSRNILLFIGARFTGTRGRCDGPRPIPPLPEDLLRDGDPMATVSMGRRKLYSTIRCARRDARHQRSCRNISSSVAGDEEPSSVFTHRQAVFVCVHVSKGRFYPRLPSARRRYRRTRNTYLRATQVAISRVNVGGLEDSESASGKRLKLENRKTAETNL